MAKENLPKRVAKHEGELKKYVENPLFDTNQVNLILKTTPKEHVYQRPAKGGGTWDYVTGVYVEKVLNLLFGWNWDFQVIHFQFMPDAEQVIVQGRLTGRVADRTVVKEHFGRADEKYKHVQVVDENGMIVYNEQGKPKLVKSNVPLDLGNDYKAAATDALKKCASLFQIAGDIYGKDEYRETVFVSDADMKKGLQKKLTDLMAICQDQGMVQAVRNDLISIPEKEITSEMLMEFIKKFEKDVND
jgi:hypothetical protein